jgi:hypothetical protein
MKPCARERSLRGSQVLNALVRFGKHPASPAPKSIRMIHSERKPHAAPVSAVKDDHHSTTRTSTRRGPIQSPSQPLGTSKSA